MSGKKSTSSAKEKRLRRELEVLKSQLKVVAEPVKAYKSSSINSTAPTNLNITDQPKLKDQKEPKYTLPMNHIKRDLSKTVLFAVFAIGVLVILSVSRVSL